MQVSDMRRCLILICLFLFSSIETVNGNSDTCENEQFSAAGGYDEFPPFTGFQSLTCFFLFRVLNNLSVGGYHDLLVFPVRSEGGLLFYSYFYKIQVSDLCR